MILTHKQHKLRHVKEEIDYYIEDETYNILDNEKHYVYCHLHFDQRIYMDENGFMQCNECKRVFGAKR
jgi:hypothetical protein